MLYLRARYANPHTGTFLTRDPVAGTMSRVMSRNGYSYVEGNPVNYTDPSGEFIGGLIGGAIGFIGGHILGNVIGNAMYNMMEPGQCGCDVKRQVKAAGQKGRDEFIGQMEKSGREFGGMLGLLIGTGPIGWLGISSSAGAGIFGPLGAAIGGAAGLGASIAGGIDAVFLKGLVNANGTPNWCSILQLGMSIAGGITSMKVIRSNFGAAVSQARSLPQSIRNLPQTIKGLPNTVRGLPQTVRSGALSLLRRGTSNVIQGALRRLPSGSIKNTLRQVSQDLLDADARDRFGTNPDIANKIPSSWGPGRPTQKGGGWRWQDPNNVNRGVPIDVGRPGVNQVLQQVDHVVVNTGSGFLDQYGNLLPGPPRDFPQAHIPLSDWRNWSSWDHP